MGNFCQKYCACLEPYIPCLFSGRVGEQDDKVIHVFSNPAVVKPEQKDIDSEKNKKPLPPLPGQHLVNICLFVALFDYEARTEEDLSFRAGDKLQVLSASNEGWWYARLLLPAGSFCPGRKLQGYIPANYIAADQTIEAEPYVYATVSTVSAWIEDSVKFAHSHGVNITPGSKELASRDTHILVTEGFLLHNYKPLIDLSNVHYYLAVPYEECKRRSTRNYTIPDQPGLFDGPMYCVWPMYLKHRRQMEDNGVDVISMLFRWFFGSIKRADAERQLSYTGNQAGAFLIRESESLKGEYVLSVFDGVSVKHYRIRNLDEGGFFLTRRQTFKTLYEFVDYYSKKSDGLCMTLRKPCLKVQIPTTFDLSYKTADQWEIDRQSLKLLKKLGSGQFGEVWEGLWNNTTPVAIKTLKPGSMDPKDFLREAQIMKNLRHPKLIQLYAVCTLEDPIYIITELMRYGSLLEYLQKDRGSQIFLPHQVDMAAQVASGMAYLESQNYIHRDLAARNVLVGEHKVYKVADFGLARVFKVENEKVYEPRAETKLPVKWTAPEAIRYNKFSVKSDVWSFGILMFEIITYGEMPYAGMPGHQVIQKVEKGYRLPQPMTCPLPFYQLMLQCWSTEADERPTFKALCTELECYFQADSSSYAQA